MIIEYFVTLATNVFSGFFSTAYGNYISDNIALVRRPQNSQSLFGQSKQWTVKPFETQK
jgi:hypothetical protein